MGASRSPSRATSASPRAAPASTSRSCGWACRGATSAFELLLTGRLIDAAEADRIGLVTRVVPDDEVLDAALETADLIVGNSPFGIRMTKEVMWSQLEVGSLQAGIDLENRTQVLASFTGDLEEAMAAFLEKRPPRFSDR